MAISFQEFSKGGAVKIVGNEIAMKPTGDENKDSWLSDLKTGWQGAVESVDRGVELSMKAGQRPTLIGRTAGQLGAGLRFAGEALGSLGSGAIRALPGGTTASNVVGDVVGAGASAVAQSDVGQGAKEAFGNLPTGVRQSLGDVGNIVMGGLGIAGAVTTPGAIGSLTKTVTSKIDDVMRKTASTGGSAIKMNSSRVGDLVNKYRVQLSNIDPRYETVLKQQPTPEKVMRYFDQAESAATDSSVPMATKLASDRAVEAYKALDAGMSEAGKMKAQLLDSISTAKIPGNIAGNSIDNVKKTIGERYGIEIDAKGNISQLKGRMASVDAKSQALIAKYVSMLRELGPAPTARQLDDFVDASQRMLYKQSSPNLYDVADAPVVAFLKQQTGEINSQLKKTVDDVLRVQGKDPSYGALNDKYAKLIELNETLSKRLGTEGDKGASMMKALYSPQTGEPTRRLFQQIRDETGIDLFEEATLAKFAMESVGDPRSKSLLQQLDVLAGDVSAVDLTKPGSWLNYLREKADLDGRDLAEQIIKQNQRRSSSMANPASTKYTNQNQGNTSASPIAPASMSNKPNIDATVPQQAPKATNLSTGARQPVQKTSYANDATIKAFEQSSGQKKVGNFELGSFGKNALARKSSQGDRFPIDEIEKTQKYIKRAYRASDDPANYRSENIAWVADMPNGEKRVIYTRKNSSGKEEILNAHTISSDAYEKKLASYGAPAGSRTRIFSLEGKRSNPLTYEGSSNIPSNKNGATNLSTGARQNIQQQAYGGVAGFEIDENGDVTFNPEKALMGMAGMTVASKLFKTKITPATIARNIDGADLRVIDDYLQATNGTLKLEKALNDPRIKKGLKFMRDAGLETSGDPEGVALVRRYLQDVRGEIPTSGGLVKRIDVKH